MSNPAVFVDCDERYAVEWVGSSHWDGDITCGVEYVCGRRATRQNYVVILKMILNNNL